MRAFRGVAAGPKGLTVRPFLRWSSTKSSAVELADNFWEQISTKPSENRISVLLGSSPLKSPQGTPITVPSTKQALAELIAHEWSVMSSLKLKNFHIPLTSLTARALDITPQEREEVAQKLLPYLDTDSLLVLAPVKDCEGRLRAEQLEKFPVLVKEAEELWGIEPLKYLDQETQLFGNYQSEATKAKVLEWVRSLDNWQFASFERATTMARSFIIGMNIALCKRPVEELAALATLDTTHQTDIWGEVEDTHDVDKVDIRRILGAAWLNAM